MINDAARPSRCLPSLPTAILSAIVPAGAASATSESGSDCRRNSVQRTTRAVMDGSYFAKRGADRPGADRPGADRPGADRPGADRPGANQPGAASPHDRNHSLFDQTAQGFYSVRRTFRARFAGLCRGGNRLAQDGELKTAARASARERERLRESNPRCHSRASENPAYGFAKRYRFPRITVRELPRAQSAHLVISHGESFGGYAQGAITGNDNRSG